ncbi:MAG: hypothetical protein AB4063_05340 [Crocosphaera sp.]
MSLNPNELHNAQLTQFKILHERAVLYTSRMWQLPFVYIASTGVTLVGVDENNTIHVIAVTIGFIIFGIFVWQIIKNIMERITMLIKDINAMERKLGLIGTFVPQKPVPYYGITLIGILLNFSILVIKIVSVNDGLILSK